MLARVGERENRRRFDLLRGKANGRTLSQRTDVIVDNGLNSCQLSSRRLCKLKKSVTYQKWRPATRDICAGFILLKFKAEMGRQAPRPLLQPACN